MTILGLQLARPRLHGFPIKFLLTNDHSGAPAGPKSHLSATMILSKKYGFRMGVVTFLGFNTRLDSHLLLGKPYAKRKFILETRWNRVAT